MQLGRDHKRICDFIRPLPDDCTEEPRPGLNSCNYEIIVNITARFFCRSGIPQTYEMIQI